MTRLRVALALLLAGCGDGDARAGAVSAQGPLPVKTVRVELRDAYAVRESYAGRVVARRRSELGFERGGRLDRVTVDEGDRVVAGQELARLEQRPLQARRRELAARLRETEARLALARVTLERRNRLAEQDSISPQRRDEALHEEQALASQLAAARAALEGVGVALALSRLTAPYAGTVAARLADEGTVLAPGQAVLHVIEEGESELRVGLPPETAARLEPGTAYRVETGGREGEAILGALVPNVDSSTRTQTAILRLSDPIVRDGALGRLYLEAERAAEGFWLPLTALTEGRRGLWSAYAVVADGQGADRVERRDLSLVHVESERAYLRGTLRSGDRVVATGLQRLVPGQAVRVLE